MLQAIGTALSPILKRIADFFDLFDLSFFVSGGISLLALAYVVAMAQPGLRRDAAVAAAGAAAEDASELGDVLDVSARDLIEDGLQAAGDVASGLRLPEDPGVGWAVACLLLAYVLGLGCFAAGRVLRHPLEMLMPRTEGAARSKRDFGRVLCEAVRDHGLDTDDIVGTYVHGNVANRRLYARMWTEIRERPDLRDSFAFIQHSWVLAATYDGVAAASLLWAAAIGLGWHPQMRSPIPASLIPVAITGLLLFAVLASYEARRHGEHQLESLLATMAHLRQTRAEAKEHGGGDEEPAIEGMDAGTAQGAQDLVPGASGGPEPGQMGGDVSDVMSPDATTEPF